MGGESFPVLFIIVVCCVITLVFSTTPKPCDDDWTGNDIYCYFFNNGDNRTWFHANEECKSRQAQLLRIESLNEYNFLKLKFRGYPTYEYWTALNQLKPYNDGGTGNWLWGTDEYPDMTLVKWNVEPDNSDDEDCGAITVQATFSDEKCSLTFPYICETDKVGDCPMGWIETDSDCFFVSNYTDSTQFKSWQAARDYCKTLKPYGDTQTKLTHLLTFDIATDTQEMSQQLPSFVTTAMFWTGLNDIKTEGTFVWDVGPKFTSSLVVWTTEPDNLAGREWCATATEDVTFSDRDCNSAFNYVCRKPQFGKSDTHDFGCGQWNRAGHKCYGFYSDPKYSWSDARTKCQKLNGDLAKIESKDELRYLTVQSTGPALDQGSYWIGLNDKKNEGTYVWADNTKSDASLINWEKSPTNYLVNQHCAALTRDGAKVDFPCKVSQLGYICEHPMDANEKCPQDWNLYNYNCYFISTDLADRETSLSICKRKHGKLLAVNDAKELAFIVAQIANYDSWPNIFWLGLNDKAVSGKWTYPDPSDNWPGMDQLVKWAAEPNNFNGNEDCVSIQFSGAMNDADCEYPKGFICEKPSSGCVSGISKWLMGLSTLCIIYHMYL